MANGRIEGAEVFIVWQHLPRQAQAMVLLSMTMQYLSRGAGGNGELETIFLADDSDPDGNGKEVRAAVVIARGPAAEKLLAYLKRSRRTAAAIVEN